MSFVQQTPRLFTRPDVESLNAGQVGVYGLFRNSCWVYVGKGDLRERLLAHLNGDNSYITKQAPTHWLGEVTQGGPSARERELILALQPRCNLRVG